MKVVTLKPHSNAYGDKFKKAKDDQYELPDNVAKTLIQQKLVKKLKAQGEPADDVGTGEAGATT